MKSYEETYLEDAMSILGEAFDYAMRVGVEPDVFMTRFIDSGIATQFEDGNPKYVTGMYGEELAMIVCERTGYPVPDIIHDISDGRTKEYWCGHVLAYCQWHSSLTFSYISQIMPASVVLNHYNPLHEASEEKVLDVLYVRRERLESVNKFIVKCVEEYADFTHQSSGAAYKELKGKGIIETLKNEYNELHGYSQAYINDYISSLLIKR